jgi:uncharacterized Fe-S cluster-containing protein
MSNQTVWSPPGKNCGLCGETDCSSFEAAVRTDGRSSSDCPYYGNESPVGAGADLSRAAHRGYDVFGNPYDFTLSPLPGEISARKIVLPFRGDLVEKLDIRSGDYVVGRPMGAGCPVPHVLQVIEAEPLTGLLYTWVVGPRFSRESPSAVKDVKAYHMVGFEGIAANIRRNPVVGLRATFLPGFCMMNLNHTGLVNMSLSKSAGPHIRIEDIRILAREAGGLGEN